MIPVKQRLDALTSLRFFAAAMIVIHHTSDLFGHSTIKDYFLLGQGVSFFFVLSGFILAYVYPKLETWSEIKQFWRARIARIYPALLASFILAYWLLSLNWDNKTAIANLLMINAWIPYPVYFFSYNSPSWSISTEFFFYLAFPFLIYRWDKTWWSKLLASGFIVISLILLSNGLHLPDYASLNDGITRYALLYIHPISRIFEFIFGMFVASYWREKVGCVQWSEARASLYEIGVILLAGASMHFVLLLTSWANKIGLGASTTRWLSLSGGSMFVFGLLIYVIAIGRGRISAWLCHPMLILLGEISFSLYLLHQILLRYYRANMTDFPLLSNVLSLTIFWVIALLASYLMWALIEMPGRLLILGKAQKKIHSTLAMQKSWHSNLNLNKKTISAAAMLICLLALMFSMGKINRISVAEADEMTPKTLQSVLGTRFGNVFTLRGVKVVYKTEGLYKAGLYIDLAWESLVDQELTYITGIHLTDANGNILVQADRRQPVVEGGVKSGTIWKDVIFIPQDKLKNNASQLAIVLYSNTQPPQTLPVDRGERDWNNHRLLINLENASVDAKNKD